MKAQTFTAPAIWASAIINLDYSGLSAISRKELNNWLLNNKLSFVDCLTCGDEYLGQFDGLLCQVCDYTFPAK